MQKTGKLTSSKSFVCTSSHTKTYAADHEEYKGRVIYSGVLKKKTGLLWPTRCFLLTSSSLCHYKRKRGKDEWKLTNKLKRGEWQLDHFASCVKKSLKHHPFCIVIGVKAKGSELHEYTIQATSAEEQEKWYILLCKGMRREKMGLDLGGQIMEQILSDDSGEDSPVKMVMQQLQSKFPVLIQLLRDFDHSEYDAELVYILDQVVGEVECGAQSEEVKKTIRFAAEKKQMEMPGIWNDAVKLAYGRIMRALHTPSPVLESSLSTRSLLSQSSVQDVNIDIEGRRNKTFAQSYKCGRILGSGTYSVVRIARHLESQKQYAVKCISKKTLKEVELHAILEEVKIMQELEHENLVPLIDYFNEDSGLYIVTPLCTGGELFDVLIKRECYTELDARKLMHKLASAISYLHSEGIVHRDLKPENILMKSTAPDSQVMIADFGFAKSTAGGLHDTACGTPGYIAPEIIHGKAYGTEVDCWSLGVILFILLCGYPPFPGENHAEILRRVAVADYNFNSPYWENVTAEAKDLVSKLLQPEPELRLTAQGVMEHPWMKMEDIDLPFNHDKQRKMSDLTPALQQMRRRFTNERSGSLDDEIKK